MMKYEFVRNEKRRFLKYNEQQRKMKRTENPDKKREN